MKRSKFTDEQICFALKMADTIVDNFSRECLGIYVDRSIKGSDVVNELDRLRLFEAQACAN